jgi:hypothetical protein
MNNIVTGLVDSQLNMILMNSDNILDSIDGNEILIRATGSE